ncbi:tRNA pseudouridine(55) synthase TruB [bacterium]|nr:tRNA pseudouridine(55) synthase TruB [bacterium]
MEQFCAPAGGVLLVDKPRGWTSFDVVKKVRGTLRVKKVGHAGTLDPMATGLLILCSGPMTRSIETFQALGKRYEGSMRLGAVTASYDAETPEEQHRPVGDIADDAIREATRKYIGDIQQLPPMYSAVKVDGKRLYSLARKGKEVERKPRPVHVSRFDITAVTLPDLAFSVDCSKGTYVRTLAHDLGQDLGCGAYLTALRRTAIGNFLADEAWTIDQIVDAAVQNGISLPRKEHKDADRKEP